MSDPIPQKGIFAIGAVLHMPEVIFIQELLHFLPGHRQHGADQPPADGGNASQPFQPCTTDQMQEHCFRIVVRRVGSGDFSRKGHQEAIAGVSCCRFQPFLPRDHLPRPHVQRDFQAVAEGFHEPGVPIGFFPAQAVIEMGRMKLDLQLFPEQIQRKEQRHGIRTAGNRTGHPVTGPEHIILIQEADQLIQHASTPDP